MFLVKKDSKTQLIFPKKEKTLILKLIIDYVVVVGCQFY